MVALFAFRERDKTHKIRKIPTNTRHFRSVFRLSSGIQAAFSVLKSRLPKPA